MREPCGGPTREAPPGRLRGTAVLAGLSVLHFSSPPPAGDTYRTAIYSIKWLSQPGVDCRRAAVLSALQLAWMRPELPGLCYLPPGNWCLRQSSRQVTLSLAATQCDQFPGAWRSLRAILKGSPLTPHSGGPQPGVMGSGIRTHLRDSFCGAVQARPPQTHVELLPGFPPQLLHMQKPLNFRTTTGVQKNLLKSTF